MKRILSNEYIFAILSKIIIIVTGILSTVFINRYLGPTLKGEYAYIINVITFIAIVSDLGIYQAYPFYKRIGTYDVQTDFINVIYFQLYGYILVMLFFSFLYKNIICLLTVLTIPVTTLFNQLSFISLVDSPNKRNKTIVVSEVFYTLALLVIFLTTKGNIALLLVLLIVKYALNIILITKDYGFKPDLKGYTFKRLIQSFYRYISFGFIPMLSLLLILLNYRADIFILNMFLEPQYIGLYSVGVTLSEKTLIFSEAMKEVLFSKTSKGESIKETILMTKFNIYFYFLLFVFILLLGKQVILVLYGKEFLDSYTVTTIIFLGNIGMVIFKMIYTCFISSGKTKVSFALLLICVSVNIILNFLLIPKAGINGSAIASVISYNVCGFCFYIYFMKVYKIEPLEIIWFKNSDFKLIINRLNAKRLKEVS